MGLDGAPSPLDVKKNGLEIAMLPTTGCYSNPNRSSSPLFACLTSSVLHTHTHTHTLPDTCPPVCSVSRLTLLCFLFTLIMTTPAALLPHPLNARAEVTKGQQKERDAACTPGEHLPTDRVAMPPPPLPPIAAQFLRTFMEEVRGNAALAEMAPVAAEMEVILTQWLHICLQPRLRETDEGGARECTAAESGRASPPPHTSTPEGGAEDAPPATIVGLDTVYRVDAAAFQATHLLHTPTPWRGAAMVRRGGCSFRNRTTASHLQVGSQDRAISKVAARGPLHGCWVDLYTLWAAAHASQADTLTAGVTRFTASWHAALGDHSAAAVAAVGMRHAVYDLMARSSGTLSSSPSAPVGDTMLCELLAEVWFAECCRVAVGGEPGAFVPSTVPTSVVHALLDYMAGEAVQQAVTTTDAVSRDGVMSNTACRSPSSRTIVNGVGRTATLYAVALHPPALKPSEADQQRHRPRHSTFADSVSDDAVGSDPDSHEGSGSYPHTHRRSATIFTPLVAPLLMYDGLAVQQCARMGELHWSTLECAD